MPVAIIPSHKTPVQVFRPIMELLNYVINLELTELKWHRHV